MPLPSSVIRWRLSRATAMVCWEVVWYGSMLAPLARLRSFIMQVVRSTLAIVCNFPNLHPFFHSPCPFGSGGGMDGFLQYHLLIVYHTYSIGSDVPLGLNMDSTDRYTPCPKPINDFICVPSHEAGMGPWWRRIGGNKGDSELENRGNCINY